MGSSRIFILSLLLGNILVSISDAANEDICGSCKRIDECPRYMEMSKEQQRQWMQDYSCKGSESYDANPIPGFSSISRGDYVCCPSTKVWGITEDTTTPASGNQDKTNPNNFHVPRYLWYDQNQPSGNGYLQPQPRLPTNPQYGFYNGGNDNYGQCPAQTSPPKPESGCCGVDLSDSDRITDLQKFLQSISSNWGSQTNYPRYKRESTMDSNSRNKRSDDINALDITLDDRIAGGYEADLDQYPWTVFLSLVFINREGEHHFVCGGSLLSSRFVLTAAHCVVNDEAELQQIDVILAEYDRRTFPRDCITVRGQNPICIENLKVSASDVYIHPNFIEQYLINDIALIRLSQNVPYTRFIRPICLPPINIDSPQFSNLPLATAGWGLNVSVESNIKQHTVVHMVPKNECKAYYNHLTEGHLCASGKKSEDTCRGDSGGPLMMMYQGKYYVAGIVSGKTAAFECGTPVPSLYTNVFNYLDWIRKYVR